jgi:hypothetical protein
LVTSAYRDFDLGGRWTLDSGERGWMLETLTPEERARFEQLDPAQQAYVERCEPLWRRAHEIARKNPGVDASDVFHVLYTWNDTPSQGASEFRVDPICVGTQ